MGLAHVHEHHVARLVQHETEQLLVSEGLAPRGIEAHPCTVGASGGHLVGYLALDARHNSSNERFTQTQLAVRKVDAAH